MFWHVSVHLSVHKGGVPTLTRSKVPTSPRPGQDLGGISRYLPPSQVRMGEGGIPKYLPPGQVRTGRGGTPRHLPPGQVRTGGGGTPRYLPPWPGQDRGGTPRYLPLPSILIRYLSPPPPRTCYTPGSMPLIQMYFHPTKSCKHTWQLYHVTNNSQSVTTLRTQILNLNSA